MNLKSMGWSDLWNDQLSNRDRIARITAKHRGLYQAMTPAGVGVNVHLSGKMQYLSQDSSELPAIGDWCLLSPVFVDESNSPAAIAESVLERKSTVKRLAAGTKAEEQILAANVDVMFIVTSANADFSINRLRRFCVLANAGGVEPVIVISKIDVATETESFFNLVRENLSELKCLLVSAVNGVGIEQIFEILTTGKTGVLVGSSGVGKSTLMNALVGEKIQKVGAIRNEDSKGRHTTSGGGLFFLKNDSMIIDTPGLREVQILGSEEHLEEIFPAISTAAENCKFRDCTHANEPGCGVLKGVADGSINDADIRQYEKLQREMAFTQRKLDKGAASNEKKKWKSINKGQRLKRKIESKR